ncbi:MAG: VCBS repeat-containing protein [Planctomycetota bacterium]|nr:MAG: VCBS repeat-containing protein [Planctomycetota bacterium]
MAHLKYAALAAGSGIFLLCGALQAQQFVNNTAQIPQGNPGNNSSSENVDFGDVDLDGDWDAVFADGGDGGNDQNRIWINQGGDQNGTVGFFLDDTVARFPSGQDQSRDIEFADIDGDTDLDIYVSNTSAIINQSNRWWVNLGGDQGGSLGFYQDETAARWVGLGGPGSSIPQSAVLASGGFIDWSCDCDFGDLDNDGDLDLFHSTYGGAFGGNVPSRIFLNDGRGFFTEFNPSGFQLAGTNILNGNPGLWCDGTQLNFTTNSDGTNCDIAMTALDIDIGDIDGDFDLDILHGSRSEFPRMFANRLDGSNLAPAMGGGQLGFRDVTGMVFPPNYASGGNYEQEMGDFDGDGDLDIYGMNWNPGVGDSTYENLGNGIFAPGVVVSGAGSDDNEADCFDYDNDGDLDIYVANFSGQDRIHRNNNNGGSGFSFTNVTGSVLPSLSRTGLDADCCDIDNDGDYDVMVGNDNGQGNYLVENVGNTPDTHAPYIPNVEQAVDRTIGSLPTVVRAQVYDNAPYYITWYNPTWVEVTVDGGAPVSYPAVSSAGQIFRAEIPGGLAGTICYRFVSEDQYGNQGQSVQLCYDSSGAGCQESNFCTAGPNSTGSPAVISSNGDCFVSNGNLVLSAGPVPDQFGLFYYGASQNNGGAGTPFGNGRQCVGAAGAQIYRLPVELASGNVLSHALDFGNPPAPSGQITAGSTWHFQAWFRDPAAGGAFFDLSDGLTITFQ